MDTLDSLEGRTIVLGVSGGIAAYKAIDLVRRLVDAGAHVVPVLTAGALRFVGEQTFSALGSERARTALFGDEDPIPHTRLGQRADLVIVAPATARVIGSYAAGISSDLLVATLLATRAPVLVCPAMHTEMWEHAAVQENLATLRRRGVHVLDPETGRLAGGDVGLGRLADPARIAEEAAKILAGTSALAGTSTGTGSPEDSGGRDLAGLRVLVTAGGTREPIDPVRFIANRSSGKQGHAIAQAAAERGAEVTLVTTVGLDAPPAAQVVRVETAQEMADAVLARSADQDIVVMAAAVADFRPAAAATTKIKKLDGPPDLVLQPTIDILAALGAVKPASQVLVGFAAETGDLAAQARSKLERKGADLVVGNDVSCEGVGFSGDTNAVTLVTRDGSTEIALTTKRKVAEAVLDEALRRLHQVRSHRSSRQSQTEGASGT
jgi:phosphopantothenoylcysteine decarboxylase/phosphopantothenate--cysteine ligase